MNCSDREGSVGLHGQVSVNRKGESSGERGRRGKDVKEGRDNRVKPTMTAHHHMILKVHFNCPKYIKCPFTHMHASLDSMLEYVERQKVCVIYVLAGTCP